MIHNDTNTTRVQYDEFAIVGIRPNPSHNKDTSDICWLSDAGFAGVSADV